MVQIKRKTTLLKKLTIGTSDLRKQETSLKEQSIKQEDIKELSNNEKSIIR